MHPSGPAVSNDEERRILQAQPVRNPSNVVIAKIILKSFGVHQLRSTDINRTTFPLPEAYDRFATVHTLRLGQFGHIDPGNQNATLKYLRHDLTLKVSQKAPCNENYT